MVKSVVFLLRSLVVVYEVFLSELPEGVKLAKAERVDADRAEAGRHKVEKGRLPVLKHHHYHHSRDDCNDVANDTSVEVGSGGGIRLFLEKGEHFVSLA